MAAGHRGCCRGHRYTRDDQVRYRADPPTSHAQRDPDSEIVQV